MSEDEHRKLLDERSKSFSPGPYKADMGIKDEPDRWVILSDNGGPACLIATIENGQFGDTIETEGHTAQLLAAAPELISALKAMLTAQMLYETAMGHGDVSAVEAANEAKWPAVDAAHAAIAKAEGRAAE